ncbi:hypothetical protein COLO4_24616 [Corchorus olitorius]|uniref:F-box domain-containing protein n=1 Tax=Corchorus olitorius TaxID=93759 RepID=A0A1R3I8P4_9ROSI|nr:hypothetical protein COLO4_24616 [Corchorus olitorius]
MELCNRPVRETDETDLVGLLSVPSLLGSVLGPKKISIGFLDFKVEPTQKDRTRPMDSPDGLCVLSVYFNLTILLEVTFVCTAWRSVTRDPLCYDQSLNFHTNWLFYNTVFPDTPFAEGICQIYDVRKLSTSRFIASMIDRGNSITTSLALPKLPSSEDEDDKSLNAAQRTTLVKVIPGFEHLHHVTLKTIYEEILANLSRNIKTLNIPDCLIDGDIDISYSVGCLNSSDDNTNLLALLPSSISFRFDGAMLGLGIQLGLGVVDDRIVAQLEGLEKSVGLGGDLDKLSVLPYDGSR